MQSFRLGGVSLRLFGGDHGTGLEGALSMQVRDAVMDDMSGCRLCLDAVV